MQIGAELDNAARVSGADWLMTFFRVLRVLITPAFAGALVLTFVIMLKEYSPAVFLSSADNNILGTTMLELWAQGKHRLRRRAGHHPDRHHRGLRRARRPAHEGKAPCLR